MTPVLPPICGFRGEHLRDLRWSLRLHMSFGGAVHAYEHQAVDFPDLVVSKLSERGLYVEHRLFVGDREVPWGDLDQAAQLLMEARGRPDDADEPCAEEKDHG